MVSIASSRSSNVDEHFDSGESMNLGNLGEEDMDETVATSSHIFRRPSMPVAPTASSHGPNPPLPNIAWSSKSSARTPPVASATTYGRSGGGSRGGRGRCVTNDTTNLVDGSRFVALLEGRGAAKGEVGIASISLASPTLALCHVSDSCSYSRTLAKLTLFSPGEILVPVGGGYFGGTLMDPLSSTSSKLYEELARSCPYSTLQQLQRKYFNEAQGLHLIKRLCAKEYASVEVHLHHKSYRHYRFDNLAAACALLKYLEQVQNVFYAPKSLRVEFQASADTTLIDTDTAKHVELLAPCVASANHKSVSSLFGLLNHCHTPAGVRLLRASLFQPTIKKEVIQERLDAIEKLRENPGLFNSMQALVSRFGDLDQLLSLCVVEPQDNAARGHQRSESLFAYERRLNHVIGLRHALELVEPLRQALGAITETDGEECDGGRLLTRCRHILEDAAYNDIFASVSRVLNDNARVQKCSAGMKLQRCFAIRGGLDGLLDIARRTYCEIVDDIERLVASLAAEHGLPLRVGCNASRGYHIQLPCGKKGPTAVDIKYLPDKFLQPQKSKSGVISFTTEELVQADARGKESLREISVMSDTIIRQLLSDIRERIGCLYKLSEAVSLLDMILALTEVSTRSGFVRPTFGQSTCVVEGRHPILDGMMSNSGQDVTANDITATLESTFHVITGANMSGKSTFLKQVILLQVMAQLGSYVPAKHAMFRVCDCIFSRMGTGDSIECHASTFELEMKETSYILSGLTSESLVVLDELGRGTSVQEGSALCWAIAEEMIKVGAFCFLATHFTMLRQLERFYCTVTNYAHQVLVPYQQTNLTCFSHHLKTEERKDEQSGSSLGLTYMHKLEQYNPQQDAETELYGIMLAKASALPKKIVQRAEEMASTMRQTSVLIPNPQASEIQRLNYVRLYNRLCLVATQDDLKGDDLKEYLLQLKEQFLGNELA